MGLRVLVLSPAVTHHTDDCGHDEEESSAPYHSSDYRYARGGWRVVPVVPLALATCLGYRPIPCKGREIRINDLLIL